MIKINNILINRLKSQSLYEILATLPTIGDRLKYLRKTYLKISRAKMANDLDLEPTTIQKYEENRTTPKISRLKEFASYFNLPVEVLTGEEVNTLIREDYFLIGNLQFFCWRIDYDKDLILNDEILKEIKIAIYKANILIVEHIHEQSDLIYIAKLFDLDTNTKNKEIIELFNTNITLLNNGDSKSDNRNIETISRVFDYAINTKDLIDKPTYNSIINELTPLIECYKNHPE